MFTHQVEEHTSCACSCKERPEDCNRSIHYHDQSSCKCRCLNQQARSDCLKQGKDWDESTCSCRCKANSWRACSSGHTYDYITSCQCKPVSVIATFGGSRYTVVGIISVILIFALAATVMHARPVFAFVRFFEYACAFRVSGWVGPIPH